MNFGVYNFRASPGASQGSQASVLRTNIVKDKEIREPSGSHRLSIR